MNTLTKEEKKKIILNIVNEEGVSSYEIAKNTSLTDAGVGKIINGSSKNPQERTLDEILKYLTNKFGSNVNAINIKESLEIGYFQFDLNKAPSEDLKKAFFLYIKKYHNELMTNQGYKLFMIEKSAQIMSDFIEKEIEK